MKTWIFILAVLSSLLLCCCMKTVEAGRIYIMSWNVQNLFDDVDNGTEYRDFDPQNGEWTYDDFTQKAAALSDVITASVPGGPDVVVLQEVENENALAHLNNNYLKACGYDYELFLPTSESAVGCAVLSRLPVLDCSSHAVYSEGFDTGRNISEVYIYSSSAGFAARLFINHWKSKLGGAEETEPGRIAAAARLNELICRAAASIPGGSEESDFEQLIAAVGDFNESYNEYELNNEEYDTAIIPVYALNEGDYPDALVYTTNKDEVRIIDGRQVLYNPWPEAEVPGSYFYNEQWETIDNFFLDRAFFDGSNFDFDSFEVIAEGYNTAPGGRPLAWSSSTKTGCSDHFPLVLSVIKVQQHQGGF